MRGSPARARGATGRRLLRRPRAGVRVAADDRRLPAGRRRARRRRRRPRAVRRGAGLRGEFEIDVELQWREAVLGRVRAGVPDDGLEEARRRPGSARRRAGAAAADSRIAWRRPATPGRRRRGRRRRRAGAGAAPRARKPSVERGRRRVDSRADVVARRRVDRLARDRAERRARPRSGPGRGTRARCGRSTTSKVTTRRPVGDARASIESSPSPSRSRRRPASPPPPAGAARARRAITASGRDARRRAAARRVPGAARTGTRPRRAGPLGRRLGGLQVRLPGRRDGRAGELDEDVRVRASAAWRAGAC